MKNNKFLTTSEASRLLNINEKKLYVLAQEGVIPATKVTGKWLFPEDELINYLKFDALKNLKKGIPFTLLENNILIGGGSDDPILSKIFAKFYNYSKINLFYTTVGSENGLNLLKNRITHFALSHIYDEKENDYNLPYLKKIFPVEEYVIINFFYREIGIISQIKISDIDELSGKNFTFILRQKGSGIRSLTEYFFKSNILKKDKLKFFKEEVNTHFEVASLVKNNKNLIGIATKSISKIFDLNFYKLFSERFDFITLKDYFFQNPVQKIYEFLLEQVRLKFPPIDGYDFSKSGKIIL